MTNQEKRGKVIKALELCTSKIETRTRVPCEICPYYNEKYHGVYMDGCCNMRSLQRDMLILLKAQEPRVMTLEEVLAAEVVYAEDIDKAEIIPVLVDRRAHDRIVLVRARLMGGPSLTIYPLISEYGKYWRCWTSRPTDEQREAEPWNVQN